MQLSQKSITFEAFEDIHQIVLNGISYIMASLDQSSKYGPMNIADTSKNGYDDIMFISEACNLKNNITIFRTIITAGE